MNKEQLSLLFEYIDARLDGGAIELAYETGRKAFKERLYALVEKAQRSDQQIVEVLRAGSASLSDLKEKLADLEVFSPSLGTVTVDQAIRDLASALQQVTATTQGLLEVVAEKIQEDDGR